MEDAGIDGRFKLNGLFRKWDRGMDWIDLTQDRDGQRAFENAKMSCGFREMWKIFDQLTNGHLFKKDSGPWSM